MDILYKKKHEVLKVKLMDGTQKLITLDWSLPVQDVIAEVAKKIQLPYSEEYGFQPEGRPSIFDFIFFKF
jgi:talin